MHSTITQKKIVTNYTSQVKDFAPSPRAITRRPKGPKVTSWISAFPVPALAGYKISVSDSNQSSANQAKALYFKGIYLRRGVAIILLCMSRAYV